MQLKEGSMLRELQKRLDPVKDGSVPITRPAINRDSIMPESIAWVFAGFTLAFSIVLWWMVAAALRGEMPGDPDGKFPFISILLFAVSLTAACGVIVVTRLRARKWKLSRERAQQRYPEMSIYRDYDWKDGKGVDRSVDVLMSDLAFSVMGIPFTAAFCFLVFSDVGTPLFVRIIAVVITGAFALLFVRLLLSLYRWARTRGSYLGIPQQPLLPEAITVNWVAPTGVRYWRRGVIKVRCIEERVTEVVSRGKHSVQIEHRQVWSDERTFGTLAERSVQPQLQALFSAPGSLPSTCISGGRTVFWEVEVRVYYGLLPFFARYLVPVYRGWTG